MQEVQPHSRQIETEPDFYSLIGSPMQTSSHRIRIYHADNCPELTRLDVNKLGRAYHRIPRIITDKFDGIETRLSIFFLKKYRLNAALANITFATDCHCKNVQIFSSPWGNIGFAINRTFLLKTLHTYYGLNKEGTSATTDLSEPVTKTEDRLQTKMGLELTRLIMLQEILNEDFELKNDFAAVINKWSFGIQFWLEGYDEYAFSLLLDANHVDRLLAMLRIESPDTEPKVRSLSPAQVEHMFTSMPLQLTGRLASVKLTVAQLLSIEPGDILPVTLNDPLPVFIGREKIFSSVIAEEKGRLYLSEFKDKNAREEE
ncbi:FliM/FliN family flagellar motor switch protein [uncultured Leclercia sp.]|uniref:flagellar motor switch protein FliM n=1 Tax=uncultured Leclercia sp. TaxID=332959 RepID=UPI0025949E26|nr:FliM/FliN family flagellar motor switch protein [uncultured Leclercia sp.]